MAITILYTKNISKERNRTKYYYQTVRYMNTSKLEFAKKQQESDALADNPVINHLRNLYETIFKNPTENAAEDLQNLTLFVEFILEETDKEINY